MKTWSYIIKGADGIEDAIKFGYHDVHDMVSDLFNKFETIYPDAKFDALEKIQVVALANSLKTFARFTTK